VDQVDQVAQVAPEPVELPGHQEITLAQCLETGGEPGPVMALARGEVLIEMPRLDTGREQRVTLQVEGLAAVGLGDAQVAELHGCHTNKRLGDRAVRPAKPDRTRHLSCRINYVVQKWLFGCFVTLSRADDG
jgi:hypothetical protein